MHVFCAVLEGRKYDRVRDMKYYYRFRQFLYFASIFHFICISSYDDMYKVLKETPD